jgi:hypothetical protein
MTGSANLCKGDNYDKEGRILLILWYTHTWDTFTCMQRFLNGETDHAFDRIFNGVIRPWRGITLAEAVEIPAVTNLCEDVQPSAIDPTGKQTTEGQRFLEQRLRTLRPNAALIFGEALKKGSLAILNASPHTRIFEAPHPCRGNKEAKIAAIRQAWDLLQTYLRSL